MHHMYKSKFLVDTLSLMGFGASYGEVQRFQKNVAALVAPNIVEEQVQGMMLAYLRQITWITTLLHLMRKGRSTGWG